MCLCVERKITKGNIVEEEKKVFVSFNTNMTLSKEILQSSSTGNLGRFIVELGYVKSLSIFDVALLFDGFF